MHSSSSHRKYPDCTSCFLVPECVWCTRNECNTPYSIEYHGTWHCNLVVMSQVVRSISPHDLYLQASSTSQPHNAHIPLKSTNTNTKRLQAQHTRHDKHKLTLVRLRKFTQEQITAWFEFKNRSHSEKGNQYTHHDEPDEDVDSRHKFERSKTSGHNPWLQLQQHTNTVLCACRPTRELTTEHELVRSVVPSTSVQRCVWQVDHTSNNGTLLASH